MSKLFVFSSDSVYQLWCVVMSKVAIITGASTGIGLQTGLQLASRYDYKTVVFAVRSPEKTLRSVPEHLLDNKVVVLYLDLASLDSVDQFVPNLVAKNITCIDRLILNAGINDYTKSTQKTIDGIDEIWQVNYLSHFYLTCLLRPMLTENARIVCLSSVMHWFGNSNRFLNLTREPESKKAHVYYYSDSKLAMAVLAAELNRRYPETLAIAVNPGSVASDIFRTWLVGILGFFLKLLASLVLLSTADGAKASVFACTDESLDKFEYISPYGQIKGKGWLMSCLTDLYWFWVARNPKEMIGECSRVVLDKITGQMLWSLSVEALGKTSNQRREFLKNFQ